MSIDDQKDIAEGTAQLRRRCTLSERLLVSQVWISYSRLIIDLNLSHEQLLFKHPAPKRREEFVCPKSEVALQLLSGESFIPVENEKDVGVGEAGVGGYYSG